MIPLFDSLTHPTITGKFGNRKAEFSELETLMNNSNFQWACAVGIDKVENYNHEQFIEKCSKYKNFIPIAGINPCKSVSELENEIRKVSSLGFKGIKIHPRHSLIGWDYETLPSVLNCAYKNNLVIMLCTYMHRELSSYPEHDPFYSMVKLLKTSPEAKVVLLHGGDVKLLQYAELVKSGKNLLLDLSFTMMKYMGSSVEQDIRFLFNTLDRKICIGTDHPEYSHNDLRERFEHLSAEISNEKKENIGYKNLINLFNIK